MSITAGQTPLKRTRTSYGNRIVGFLVGTALAVGLTVLLMWNAVVTHIPPGHVGVHYSLLGGGTMTHFVHPEGIAFKLPWDTIYVMETRVQSLPIALLAFSDEGMPIDVEATVLYRIKASEAPRVLVEVGPDYRERIVAPVAISALRLIIGHYDSHDLYTVSANELQADLLATLRGTAESRYIFYSEIAIRTMKLPESVVSAIQHKLSEEQRAAAYEFRLTSQRQEAERLRIEAIGLRNFYSIVQGALTDKLLTWRGIEATVQVARSPNSKIVIVGGNKDQLPLILGSDITRGPTPGEPQVEAVEGTASPLPDWSNLPPLFPGGAPSDPRRYGNAAPGVPVPPGPAIPAPTVPAPAPAPAPALRGPASP